jgi:murein L,D-transpeptidase YafK
MDSVVENGFAELVRQAIKGDQDVLDFFGLEAPLTEDNMKAAAAAALNKFWEMARG